MTARFVVSALARKERRARRAKALTTSQRKKLHRKDGNKHFLIEDVPAGVCTECGTRYYSANVLKTIKQTIVSGQRKAKREVLMPVFSW